jgi:NADPH:quinone reductase-like Zn-dependent oxidoreductase
VEEVGEGVTWLDRGDFVVANPLYGCGRCYNCSRGLEILCDEWRMIGYHTWGSYAELVKVPARTLVKLSKPPLDPNVMGIIPQAYFTAWRAMKIASVKPGDRVLVWGATGGVGVFAVQIAKYLGATVIGVGGPEWKLQKLRELGVDLAVSYLDPDFKAKVLKFTENVGVDVVINSVGGRTLLDSLDMAKRGATIVVFGILAGASVNLPIRKFYLKNLRLMGAILSTRADAIEALEALKTGRIKLVIGATLKLWDASKAHEMLEKGEVFGKILLSVR